MNKYKLIAVVYTTIYNIRKINKFDKAYIFVSHLFTFYMFFTFMLISIKCT